MLEFLKALEEKLTNIVGFVPCYWIMYTKFDLNGQIMRLHTNDYARAERMFYDILDRDDENICSMGLFNNVTWKATIWISRTQNIRFLWDTYQAVKVRPE